MGKRKCGCVTADSSNTPAVRKGYELGGYVKTLCAKHAEHERQFHLPFRPNEESASMTKKTGKSYPVHITGHEPALKVRRTLPRYVYHVSGHAKLHAPTRPNAGADSQQVPQAVPFELVIRHPSPITRDEDMEALRRDVRNHVQDELKKADSPYLVGDTMIRGLSFLHTIYVDCDDVDGEPARVLTQGA